jgi:hypothetical protein
VIGAPAWAARPGGPGDDDGRWCFDACNPRRLAPDYAPVQPAQCGTMRQWGRFLIMDTRAFPPRPPLQTGKLRTD